MLFLDKIEKGIIYVMGQKVHRNDEKYYLKLLEEGRRKEQKIRMAATAVKITLANAPFIKIYTCCDVINPASVSILLL